MIMDVKIILLIIITKNNIKQVVIHSSKQPDIEVATIDYRSIAYLLSHAYRRIIVRHLASK